jgi:uncharacterized protein GlcG (DUF336 family)
MAGCDIIVTVATAEWHYPRSTKRNREKHMNRIAAALVSMAGGMTFFATTALPDTLQTHRIPAALALEAVGEGVAACAKQGYSETITLLDADGTTIATLRGDGAGIHTLDSAHDKAYTSVSFKNDTLALEDRAKGENSLAPLSKLPHVMFFGGGVVVKIGNEVIGAIGGAGAPGAKLDDGCARAGLDKIRDRLK